MSASLVWSRIDWQSNPNYPWHNLSSMQINLVGHVSMQSNQWVIIFQIQGTDPNLQQYHDWLVWVTATSDGSGNLTLGPLQMADMRPYGVTLAALNPHLFSWQTVCAALPATPGVQAPTVDVLLYVNNIFGRSGQFATNFVDAFIPVNVNLNTGAISAGSIAQIDVTPFYFFNSFFGFWTAPFYNSYSNTKVKVQSSVIAGQVGRVDAVAGTCSPVHSFASNFVRNVGNPGNPVILDPVGNQYMQMPFNSSDMLFSSLTVNANPVNMQNMNIWPTVFPAGIGPGVSGSTMLWNDPNFPFTTIHGGDLTGFVSNVSNPGTWNQGATSWSIPAGVATPPGGSSAPMMTQAPDNEIISGKLAILGCMGGTTQSPGTSTEVYELGQTGDYSPFLISHKSYPAMDANKRAVAVNGYSDLVGNPIWMFHDIAEGGGSWTNSDWLLWAGAVSVTNAWSIGGLLLAAPPSPTVVF